jgi:hypothetical protein
LVPNWQTRRVVAAAGVGFGVGQAVVVGRYGYGYGYSRSRGQVLAHFALVLALAPPFAAIVFRPISWLRKMNGVVIALRIRLGDDGPMPHLDPILTLVLLPLVATARDRWAHRRKILDRHQDQKWRMFVVLFVKARMNVVALVKAWALALV